MFGIIFKIILILIMTSFIHAAVWSSSRDDGINKAFSQLDELVNRLNEGSRQKWENEIYPLIEKIAEETKKKNTLLKEIEALEKEKAMDEKKAIFYLEQEKRLLGNYNSLIGEEAGAGSE